MAFVGTPVFNTFSDNNHKMKTVILKILCLYLLMTFSFDASTQNKTIDSLQKVLQTQKQDTNRVNTLNALSTHSLNNKDSKKTLFYAEEAITLAIKIDFQKG